jgi:hypothetical protein
MRLKVLLFDSFRVYFCIFSTRFECISAYSQLVSSVFLHILHSFRVYFCIFSTRFECISAYSPLVSMEVSSPDIFLLSAISQLIPDFPGGSVPNPVPDFEEWGIDTQPAGTRPVASSFFIYKKQVIKYYFGDYKELATFQVPKKGEFFVVKNEAADLTDPARKAQFFDKIRQRILNQIEGYSTYSPFEMYLKYHAVVALRNGAVAGSPGQPTNDTMATYAKNLMATSEFKTVKSGFGHGSVYDAKMKAERAAPERGVTAAAGSVPVRAAAGTFQALVITPEATLTFEALMNAFYKVVGGKNPCKLKMIVVCDSHFTTLLSSNTLTQVQKIGKNKTISELFFWVKIFCARFE